MLSRGGELMAGHPYCQAWLGAEGLPLRREASQNPAMLQGKDRFFGGSSDSGNLLPLQCLQARGVISPFSGEAKGTWGVQESCTSL
jgi:hypothetical protein